MIASGLTPEQIEMRKTGIGASETPMLVGESPHGGAIDVYLRKLGLVTDAPNDAKELGNILEAGIVEWYERKVGAVCEKATTIRHRTHPRSLATPDRWVNGRQKICQCKLVGGWMSWHWSLNQPPPYVLVQVQKEMEVADVDFCDVVALIGGTDPRIYQIERDRELGADLIAIDEAFWNDHIGPRIPPAVDGTKAATAMLRALHPRHSERILEPTEDIESLVEDLRVADAACDAASHEWAIAEQKIKSLMADAQSVRGDSWSITWRTSTNGARPFKFNDARKRKAA